MSKVINDPNFKEFLSFLKKASKNKSDDAKTVNENPTVKDAKTVKEETKDVKPLQPPKPPKHWIIRIGDARHFWTTAVINTWGMKSRMYSYFFDYVREGDIIWFMQRATRGTLVAVATYVSHNKRSTRTPTNEEYGWVLHTPEFGGKWDTELHYKNLYDLRDKEDYDFCTEIVSPCPNAVVPQSVQDLSVINLETSYEHVETNYELFNTPTINDDNEQ